MSDAEEQLTARAREEGVPLENLVRRHLLHAVLARWSGSPSAGDFVLRGGLMTQLWVGPRRRETRDVDFLGLFPRDAADAERRLQEILRTPRNDGVSFDLDTLHGGVIWQETDFPGLRFGLQVRAVGQELDLQIDVGFDDPLVPPAEWIDYPCLIGPAARVQAVRPELLVAWKLDGLFDHGARRWQPKDLYDLYLLTTDCFLDHAMLVEGIRIAFATHSDPLEQVREVVYSRAWWETEAARGKWAKFRAAAGVPIPENLPEVAEAVARALRPAMQELIALPEEPSPLPTPSPTKGRGG